MSILTDTLAGQVVEAVRQAGALLTVPSAVQTVVPKSRTDFVTNVDLTVQNTLRGQLEQLAPAVQFLGEEGEKTAIDPRRPFWILDPVDGTTNLIHQFRHSAVSLALAEGGQVCFGVVYQPYTGECFTARRGQGAFLNGRSIRVSEAARLADSLLSTGTVPGRRELADRAFCQMRALYDRCQDIRRAGCASLDLCWVARFMLFLQQFLNVFHIIDPCFCTPEEGEEIRKKQEAAKMRTGYYGVWAKCRNITVEESDGETHQALEDIALMRVLPHMRVLVPADYNAARAAIKLAAKTPGPFYVRMGREPLPEVYGEDFSVDTEAFANVVREGSDISIMACGVELAHALKAAELLAEEGISAEVVDIMSIKPLDEETILASAAKTGVVLTVEEHSVYGGMGSAVAELLAEKHPCRVSRLGMTGFGQSGNAAELLAHYGLDAAGIVARVHEVLGK